MNQLETIRRAYRYVVAYERRILDTISRIDSVIHEAGFERWMPERWTPLYRAFPSRSWSPDRWAWDNVPCYAVRYKWVKGAANTAGTRYVLVDHIADTAFEKKRLSDKNEPDPLEDLPPPDSVRSVLRWHVIEQDEPMPDAIWNLQWHDLIAKRSRISVAEFSLSEPTLSPVKREGSGLRTWTSCVDIASLDTPESLDANFINPLREQLSANRG